MDVVIPKGEQGAQHHQTLALRVRYIAAQKQYVDPRASQNETLAVLKPKVLEFFGLKEGPVEGGTKTYFIAQNGVVQTDLTLTLGALADGKEELKLDLIERFEQG